MLYCWRRAGNAPTVSFHRYSLPGVTPSTMQPPGNRMKEGFNAAIASTRSRRSLPNRHLGSPLPQYSASISVTQSKSQTTGSPSRRIRSMRSLPYSVPRPCREAASKCQSSASRRTEACGSSTDTVASDADASHRNVAASVSGSPYRSTTDTRISQSPATGRRTIENSYPCPFTIDIAQAWAFAPPPLYPRFSTRAGAGSMPCPPCTDRRAYRLCECTGGAGQSVDTGRPCSSGRCVPQLTADTPSNCQNRSGSDWARHRCEPCTRRLWWSRYTPSKL